MPVAPRRPPVLQDRVSRGTWAVAAGVLTKDQLRSSAWRRLRQDVYAEATLTVDHRLLARGVNLVMPRSAALGDSPRQGCGGRVGWRRRRTR